VALALNARSIIEILRGADFLSGLKFQSTVEFAGKEPTANSELGGLKAKKRQGLTRT
jgi:hypothetical protein